MSGRDVRWTENKKTLVDAAVMADVDPGIIAKIAGFESNFNPDARPISVRNPSSNTVRQFDGTMAISSAHGFGQFIDKTWHEVVRIHGEKYGVENATQMTREQTNAPEVRSNRTLQAGVLAEFTKENIEKGRRLGGPDVDANVYAFHNLGDRDATTFLNALKNDPSQRADSVLSRKVILGNPSLYGDGSRSVAQSYDAMGRHMQRYERYAIEAAALARDNTIERIQQNLNTLGITDARGEPLEVVGIRGGPGSRTNEAIAAFQRQTSLPGDLPSQRTAAGLLAATNAALDARDPMHHFKRSLDDIGQHVAAGAAVPPQRAASQSHTGLPDFLVQARSADAATTTAPATSMPSQAERAPPPQRREVPVTSEATTAAPPALPQSGLQPGNRGRNVAALQQHLHVLGATDRDGRPLQVDGHYGQRTQEAVEQFQLWSGREANGIADKDTLQALAVQSRFAALQREQGIGPGRHLADNLAPSGPARADAAELRYPSVVASPNAGNAAELRSFSQPEHPQHALYSQLKSALPEYTSEQRLAQFTAALHVEGVRPGDLKAIDVSAERAQFTTRWGASTSIELASARPPSIEQSLQKVENHHQELQEQAAQRAQAEWQQHAQAMQH